MSCLDISSILLPAWSGFIIFLNSSFISSFLSALAGAGFGVWGAQRLAVRASRVRELLEAFRQANAIIVLASTVSNQALSLKKQLVKPLSDRYFQDRDVAKTANDQLLRCVVVQPISLQAQLTKITPMSLPVEALKSITYSAQLMPGRAFALVSMVEQSVNDLENVIIIRSKMIDDFHAASLPPTIFNQEYYGLQRQDGNVNSMYHDIMVAIAHYTNDVAFFSAELAAELQTHGALVREKLLKLRRDVPKVSSVDFSDARESGLMPPREDYASWLAGFKSQD